MASDGLPGGLQSSATAPVMAKGALPLCVDLDGTLTFSDTLVEGLIGSVTTANPLRSFSALAKRGRAGLKQHVATACPPDAALLPYCEPLLEYIRAERANGRYIVLVTAADEQVARCVAEHLGCFDEVIASDGHQNIKGAAKAAALMRRFGRAGFVYAGNDLSDMHIWREAGGIIIVNASRRIAEAARKLGPVEAEFPPVRDAPRGIVRALRPHQWSKNLLVFIPLFTAHVLHSWQDWLAALTAFVAFSTVASAIYIVNDLTDLAADRKHVRKRRRPFASGLVPVHVGLLVAAGLLSAGLLIAALDGIVSVVVFYALLSVSYSLWLKKMPLVDVFILAGLYVVRILAGAVAIEHKLSLWLLGFSAFLFLSLAFVKRVAEMLVAAQRDDAWISRRGYHSKDVAILQSFGVASAFAAAIVLALFVQAEATAQRYSSPTLLWAIVPLVLFWECRIWLSAARGYMHDDPIIYAARDWVSWLTVVSALLILVLGKSVTGLQL